MKFKDNKYFKELIDNATTNQEHGSNFSELLYEQILYQIVEDEEDFIENLRDMILYEILTDEMTLLNYKRKLWKVD